MQAAATLLQALRAWFWPLALIFLFVEFESSLKELVREAPQLLRSANKFSVGSVSLEVEKAAASAHSQQQLGVVRRLPRESLAVLSMASDSHCNLLYIYEGTSGRVIELKPEADRQGVAELLRVGLVSMEIELGEWQRRLLKNSLPPPRSTPGQSGKPAASFTLRNRLDSDFRLEQGCFHLTESGRQARELVLAAVTWQLSLPAP